MVRLLLLLDSVCEWILYVFCTQYSFSSMSNSITFSLSPAVVLLLQSSPRKNIIRSGQVQHRQGPLSHHAQNSSNCPASWSPGYGLLDHKALLKAPAAPAGTRPAAAARRLVLTSSKQSPSKVMSGLVCLAHADSCLQEPAACMIGWIARKEQ
jgi:hypothetical protein